MHSNKDLQKQVIVAAQEFGVGSVLFRNAIGRKIGLNITDMGCLNLLFIKGTSPPTELARFTGLTTGSTTAMLDRLEKVGFITRKPNPDDRRGVLVEIAPQSREAVGPLVAGVQKAHNELLASYTDEELEIIAGLFDTLYKERGKPYKNHRRLDGIAAKKRSLPFLVFYALTNIRQAHQAV